MAALIEATARVLEDRGWSGTTTNHIAVRAGVSVGTLYEYFPGKEALVAALVDQHMEEAEERLVALGALLSREALGLEALVTTIVTLMLELHAEAPRLHRVLVEEVPHPPAVLERLRAMEEAQTVALASLFSELLPLKDPQLSARVTIGLLEALTHRWILSETGAPLPRAQLQTELERLILAYLRAG